MAEINCETLKNGEVKIVVYLSPAEVDLMVTSWDMPLEFKHALLDAKNCAVNLRNKPTSDV
jgi:hypothetical protein